MYRGMELRYSSNSQTFWADTRGDAHSFLSPWTSTTDLPVLSLLPERKKSLLIMNIKSF